jgi:hypothetical protein
MPRASLTPIIPPRKLGVPLPTDIHTLASPLSGNATPYTTQRRRTYRDFPAPIKDRVQSICAGMTLSFAHLQGTSDKKSVLQLLIAICEAVTEPDPKLREQMESLIFTEVAARLGISRCVVTESLRLVQRCCTKRCGWFTRMCSCFSAV